MRAFEKRLATMETQMRDGDNDFSGMTDEELDAFIQRLLTKAYKAGAALAEVGEAVQEINEDTRPEFVSRDYVWDEACQIVTRRDDLIPATRR